MFASKRFYQLISGSLGRLLILYSAAGKDNFIVFLQIGVALVVEHDALTAGRSSCWNAAIVDRLCPAVVKVDSRFLVHVRALATTESVLTLSLQVDQLRSAVLTWCILVSHSRLHDLL